MGGCHRVSAVVTSPGCPPQCPKPEGPGPSEHRCLLRLLQTFPRGLPASTPPHTVHLLSIPLSKRSCGDITQIGMSLHPSPCHGFAVLWSPRLRPRPAGSSWITFQVQLWAPVQPPRPPPRDSAPQPGACSLAFPWLSPGRALFPQAPHRWPCGDLPLPRCHLLREACLGHPVEGSPAHTPFCLS